MLSVALFLSFISLSISGQSVRYVALIYRHGDRTPVNPYPTDPWRNESLWPVKFGELTNEGKRQHYKLGQWLRKRYSHILSETFDPAEIYVRSTDMDRTLMSAQVNLAGMYPPVNDTVWNPRLLWQPIPVHTVPELEDAVLAMKKPCRAYSEELDKLYHSKPYQQRLFKYQPLMSYIAAHSGSKITNYNNIEYIYNTLKIETLYNFTLPNWTRSVFPDKMEEPACYSFSTSTMTPLLARLKVGPLFKEIVGHMVNVTQYYGKKNILKMAIYSAHDDTIGDILSALNVFDGKCPEYTATVFLELIYDSKTAAYFVKISYRNSVNIVEPVVLNIKYCGQICPLEKFLRLYQNLLPSNWDYECGKQFPPVLAVSFLLGLALFLTIYVGHKIYFSRISKQYGIEVHYSHVDTVIVTPVKL